MLIPSCLLPQGGSTKYHLRTRWLQIFTSERDRRDLVSIISNKSLELVISVFISATYMADLIVLKKGYIVVVIEEVTRPL